MSRTTPNPKMRNVAERLIAYEFSVGNPSPASWPPAPFRATEKLRRALSTLAGAAGFHSLLTRALVLAKREVPSLAAVHVKADGSLEDLGKILNGAETEAGVMLIAQLLGLLDTFIGEHLTLDLVRHAWPDLPVNDTNPGEII